MSPGLTAAPVARLPEDVQGHPVLDRAGEIQVLGLGVDRPALAAIQEVYGDERRVAYHVLEAAETEFIRPPVGQ